MNPPPPDAPRPSMEVRAARASSVIVHRVPPGRADRFLALQRDIHRAAEAFPGFQGAEVYPPADAARPEWVVVLHFDTAAALRGWLDSPERAGWVARLRDEVGEFRLRTLPGGFGPWFADAPASWKVALTVLLGLYPTVMLLTLFVGPYTSRLGLALSMLVGNALSVALLQWAVMPALDAALRPWHRAPWGERKALTLGGLVLNLLALAAMAALFRLAAG